MLCALLLGLWQFAGTREVTPVVASKSLGRLHASGRGLVDVDGAPFRWRFATGFALVEQVAHGRTTEARAFLQWSKKTGFNGVRVLAMARSLFRLTPVDGRTALPRLLQLAAAADQYVEVVALADTKAYGMDARAARRQVSAIATMCDRVDNCLLELANEPYHPTQSAVVGDGKFLTTTAASLPRRLLISPGAAPASRKLYGGGSYVTVHLERLADWDAVANVGALWELSRQTGKYVVSDEPIGADEQSDSGRRSANPSVWFAFGALSRITETGATFHFEDGLRAARPRAVQQQCAEAFIAGTRAIPSEEQLEFVNLAAPGAPHAYAGIHGSRGWAVFFGPNGEGSHELAGGWKLGNVLAERPGVRVVELTR